MEWSIYNHLYYSSKAKNYLLYSSLSNQLIELEQDDYEIILQIKENPDLVDPADDQLKFLFDGCFIVESNNNEINKLMLSTIAKRFNPGLLSLTIAPTRACNFNCPYCYEESRPNKRMSQKVQTGIIDFVKNRSDRLNTLGVVWYGGEPSLEINTIRSLSERLQNLVENYSAYMVTNGYRLDRLIDYLPELKIDRLQVTLDGTQETHNLTRHLKNGGGTYDKILSNIEKLLAKYHHIGISIRMNISKTNSHQYILLYKELQKRFGQRVNLYPAFVRDYGGGGCAAGSCYEDTNMKAEFLKDIFEKESVYTKDIYPWRSNKGCMMQQMNSFVVGVDGELYKCWHHLGVSEKVVGSIFAPQTITNYSLLADMMMKEDVIMDNQCKTCVLFPSCYGGCVEEKERRQDYCIPAKARLEDFIDIHYTVKTRKS